MKPHPTPVLTPAQMREVDRSTIDAGIPGIILMENAAHRVVEYLAEKFAPLSRHHIVVVCGKGNNGGDALAVARLLHVVHAPAELRAVLTCEPEELRGDAQANLDMMRASGLEEFRTFGPEMRSATLVIDGVLGTGLEGAASGSALDAIRQINSGFPYATVVAIDIPSGLSGASHQPPGEYVRADATVTFTAPKVCHAMPPAAELMGDLRIAPIGTPPSLYDNDQFRQLAWITPESIAPLFAPRKRDSNKGMYGHVLVIAGSRGKSGAAAMAGLAALRAGAGLVTVACPESALSSVASFAPEIMTEPLPETREGFLSLEASLKILELARTRTAAAIGPGLGTHDETRDLIVKLFSELPLPMIVDADALNAIAGTDWKGGEHTRILTPHPGEMARLSGKTVRDVQSDRITAARKLAGARNATVVLKGNGTLLAFPDGPVWINPTGSPSMATGGTGDILTGMVAGLHAQFPSDWRLATAAAVYLHGAAGALAADDLMEQPVIATDLLHYLGEAIRALTDIPDGE